MSGLFGGGDQPAQVQYAPLSGDALQSETPKAQPEVKPEGGPIDRSVLQRVEDQTKSNTDDEQSLLGT